MPPQQGSAQLPARGPEREVDVLRHAISHLQQRLPPGWTTSVRTDTWVGHRRVDALVDLTGTDQAHAVLLIEAKRSVLTRDLPRMIDQLRSATEHLAQPAAPVLAARYLPRSARAWLEDHGVSYADATGNLWIVLERPALFVRDTGADRDPWRGPGRPRGTLLGPPAATVVRALVDFAPPVTVRELLRRAATSTGTTYRVVDFLEREALIERGPDGSITAVAWRRLLERWSEDYEFQRSNNVTALLQPRGIPAVLSALRNSPGLRYAVTGSLAAERLAPYAPPRLAMIYVDDTREAATSLDLRTVDGGANVLLAETRYDVVFDRLVETADLKFVAPAQAAVDLLSGPGRSPAEAHALLDWMQAHEPDWRS